MYALIEISNQMLEDSAFDMEGEIRGEATEQFAVKEGAEIRGTVRAGQKGKPAHASPTDATSSHHSARLGWVTFRVAKPASNT